MPPLKPGARVPSRFALLLLILAASISTLTLVCSSRSLVLPSIWPQRTSTWDTAPSFAEHFLAPGPSADGAGAGSAAAEPRPKPKTQAEWLIEQVHKCPNLALAWVPPKPPLVAAASAAAEAEPGPGEEPRFGKAKARGLGFVRTTAGARTCFELLAVDSMGVHFDQGPIQRAFFQVMLRLATGKGAAPQVHVAAEVQYQPQSSTHVACYTAPVAGQYHLAVLLIFQNAWRVASSVDKRNSQGYAFHKVVGQVRVDVSPPPQQRRGRALAGAAGAAAGASKEKLLAPLRRALPACSGDLLSESGNEGSWVGQHWLPRACENELLRNEDILRFLNGKRVAFIGDSEMRYAFNMLRRWLYFNSTQAFVQAAQRLPLFFNRLKLPYSPQEVLPFNVTTCKVITRQEALENGDFTFYGTIHSGFGLYQVKRPSARNRRISYSFNITYVAQLGATLPVSQKWMADPAVTEGATVPDESGPYDVAFVALGLHDVSRFQNATSFAAAFKENYLPQLWRLVKSRTSVVFFGMWAADEFHKKPGWRHCSNNVRINEFEAAQKRVLQEAGFTNFISTRLMTAARPDLCLDSTHYSWPITLGMLNLAFTSLR